jgi:hypothetical protein
MFYSGLPKSQETLVTLCTVFGQGISADVGNSYFVPGGIILLKYSLFSYILNGYINENTIYIYI